MHVALGRCLKAPPIDYGITQDTGGHIAYVLGAASAQVRSSPSVRVSIVTRAFDEPDLDEQHSRLRQRIGERLHIVRLRTGNARYLSKSALAAELPALCRALARLVERDPPDVVHAHFADAATIALDALGGRAFPVLYTPHSLALDKRRRRTVPCGDDGSAARLARETRAIVEADAIIVSSDDEARHQVGAYDASAVERCTVVRPGVQLLPSTGTGLASALVDPFLSDPDRPLVLAIARPVNKKNLPMLLDAYGRSTALRRRANLAILAGQHERIRAERDEQTRELDRLHALVARHALAGRVALPPSHAAGTVAQLYRLAARRHGLFVNPARHEPFGLTLIEAARFGLPVVATRNGGPRDIVATLGHGRLVDPGDRDGIAAACLSLLDDPVAYRAASCSALRRNALYSWEAWAESVTDIIGRVRTMRRSPEAAAADAITAISALAGPAGPRAPSATNAMRASHFLAFDIDDTLTGCRDGVERFRRWVGSRSSKRLPFAVATGRELPDAIRVIERWGLPGPDVWLTSVGTEIWRPSASGELVRCEAFARHLSERWDRGTIERRLGAIGLRRQGTETQRPWKLSVFGTDADAERVAAALAGADGETPLPVRVIASHGRFVDVVPHRAGKAAAIEFEAARHGVPMSRCVSAGNSGNDADMLGRCGKAILVANALPEITGILDREGLYRASTSHAHGVLEGLAAFDIRPAPHVIAATERDTA